ncbi:MAG TPA: toxin-antitoxin system, antitoxin component, Xre family protein [Candidatus Binatia bacterium]|nr:toxin-antitoxin system, antitoxin component, Xre family protein [Candidatus Binatia bacterium]
MSSVNAHRRQDVHADSTQVQALIEKIRVLPPEKLAEVEDFVDFLRQRDEDRRLTRAAAGLSEAAFQKIWDNPDDADYDHL